MLFSFLLDKYLEHRVDTCFIFKTLSNRTYHSMPPLARYEGSNFPTLCLILAILVGVQQYLIVFNLHFLKDIVCFIMSLLPFHYHLL